MSIAYNVCHKFAATMCGRVYAISFATRLIRQVPHELTQLYPVSLAHSFIRFLKHSNKPQPHIHSLPPLYHLARHLIYFLIPTIWRTNLFDLSHDLFGLCIGERRKEGATGKGLEPAVERGGQTGWARVNGDRERFKAF